MKPYCYFLIIIYIFLFSSCDKYDLAGMMGATSSTVDERFAQSMAYNETHGYPNFVLPQASYRVYVASDLHVESTTQNLDSFVMRSIRDNQAAPFVIVLGDLVSGKGHMDTCVAHLSRLWKQGNDTCLSVLGNHDIMFKEWDAYRAYWQTATYYFVVKADTVQDLYIVLDSGNGTLGDKQCRWLEQTLEWAKSQPFRHRIVLTHTNFFWENKSQGLTSSFAKEETYYLCHLFSSHQVDLVLQGHSHVRNLTQMQGVPYLRLDGMMDGSENGSFCEISMADSLSWQFIPIP